jgi:hypothetical protein
MHSEENLVASYAWAYRGTFFRNAVDDLRCKIGRFSLRVTFHNMKTIQSKRFVQNCLAGMHSEENLVASYA